MCDKTATYRYMSSDEAVNSYSCDKCRKEFGHAHGPLNFCCVCGVKFSGERECRPKHTPRWEYEKTQKGYYRSYVNSKKVSHYERLVMIQNIRYRSGSGFTHTVRKPLYGWAHIGSLTRRFNAMIDEIKMAKHEYAEMMGEADGLIESCTITFEMEKTEYAQSLQEVWIKKEEENS